ncbi:MAG: hypothetical protein OHK0022_46550 [Roseiflexaceae bacterium]
MWEEAAVTEVPAVSGEAVQPWAAAFLSQWPTPDPGVAVALSATWCRLTRARVFPDLRVVAGQLPIRDGATPLGTLPLETRVDSMWVAGPVESQTWRAPVWYEWTNEGWQCEVNIQAGWSFWGMPQYPECQALVAAIHRLIGQGWRLAAVSHFFEELFPRP